MKFFEETKHYRVFIRIKKKTYMKKIIFAICFLLSFFQTNAQTYDHIKLGLSSDSSNLFLDLQTNFDIDSSFGITTSVMTVRWIATPGVFLDVSQKELADNSWQSLISLWFADEPLEFDGIYSYQKIITSGVFDENTILDSSIVYHFLKIPYQNNSGACVTFEVVDDAFQENVFQCNCSWWTSILYPPMNFYGGGVDATYPTFQGNRYIIEQESVIVGCGTEIKEDKTIKDIIFPNPCQAVINFNDYIGGKRICIFDVSGKIIFNTFSSGKSIDVSSLESGTYIIDIDGEKQKLIKQ